MWAFLWLSLFGAWAQEPENVSLDETEDTQEEEPEWDVNAPPGNAQFVDIDVRTGTWMSVDVSPDGSTLVFDLLGDIYTLPITGGEATAITSGMAWDMQPKF